MNTESRDQQAQRGHPHNFTTKWIGHVVERVDIPNIPKKCKLVLVVWEDAAIDLNKSGEAKELRKASTPAIRFTPGWHVGNEVTLMWTLDVDKGEPSYEYEIRIPRRTVRATIPLLGR